jgi:hypothetical protein
VIDLRSVILEARALAKAIEDEAAPERSGNIVVSGMLCEQLARELGAGAAPGSVVVDGAAKLATAEVLVHVMAAEPSAADEAVVRAADREGVPVVLVQLWPQEEWKPPFILTPFVVECRAGQGFPVGEIAARIADSAEHSRGLARRVPVLHEVVTNRLVATSTLRSGAVALVARKTGSRPLLALEQVRTLTRLRSLQHDGGRHELPTVAGVAVGALGLSFVLREVARRARETLPAPVVDAALAAGTTWALAQAARRFELAGS